MKKRQLKKNRKKYLRNNWWKAFIGAVNGGITLEMLNNVWEAAVSIKIGQGEKK